MRARPRASWNTGPRLPLLGHEIRGDTGRCGETRGDLGRYGEIRRDLGRSKETWGDLGRSGASCLAGGAEGERRGEGEVEEADGGGGEGHECHRKHREPSTIPPQSRIQCGFSSVGGVVEGCGGSGASASASICELRTRLVEVPNSESNSPS